MLRFVNNTFFIHNYFTNSIKDHQENPFDNFEKLVKEYLHMERLKEYIYRKWIRSCQCSYHAVNTLQPN
jgi:hypothetical protein